MEKRFELALGLLMLLLVAALSGYGFEAVRVKPVAVKTQATKPVTVVVDAGHGGVDPGKVGAGDVLEKDINLAIAGKLKTFLEASDVNVVMTRETDAGLYEESAGNKKNADMRERCRIIEESGAVLVVSVHQNSYQDSKVRGPQVFYYTQSSEGRALAEEIQDAFTGLLGEGNTRAAKGNSEYYLLLHVAQPIVIVECGFLSNPEEGKNLCDAKYQEKVAWAIHLGVMRYLNREVVA